MRVRVLRAGSGKTVVVALCLALLALLVHSRALTLGFAFDDEPVITANPNLSNGISPRSIAWAFGNFYVANWYPLTWISHLLDVTLFGMHPFGHHLTSLLLHAANAALLFLVLLRMTGSPWPGAAAAALFAVHPLHVESVAWVAERKDVLSTLFWLLAMMAYGRYARRPSRGWMAAVAALMAAGLMAKPMLVTLPFALLLLDFWPLGRMIPGGVPGKASAKALLSLAWEKWPLFLLAAASSEITYRAQSAWAALATWEDIPFSARLANALVSFSAYLRKGIWPLDLAAFYPHPERDIEAGPAAAAAVMLAAVTFLVLRALRGRPYLATGWFWYVGTLMPVSGLVQVGAQSMADRYTYVPFMGIYVIVAWGGGGLAARLGLPKRAVAALAAAAVLALSVVTAVQAGYWQDDLSLFKRAMEVTRDNWMANYNYGVALARADRKVEAIGYFREALRIRPDYPEVHNYWGLVLSSMGRYKEAIPHYREALSFAPAFPGARTNLGVALAAAGDAAGALTQLQKALRQDPADPIARYNLGLLLDRQGMPAAAQAQYEEARRLKPDMADAHNNIGILKARRGDLQGAGEDFRRALQADPGHIGARENLKRIEDMGAGGGTTGMTP